MKKSLIVPFLLAATSAWAQNAVLQNGPVVPGNGVQWALDHQIKDSGYPFPGPIGGILGANPTVQGNATYWDNTIGTLMNDAGGPPVIKVPTNTALKAIKRGPGTLLVRRTGFYTDGDGPQEDFLLASGTCAAGGRTSDNFSCIDADDGNSLIGILPGYVDVHWAGALDDAVPGPVGAACSGITGTDNQPFFTTVFAYIKANHLGMVARGKGIYRLNSKFTITGFADPQPWNSNTQDSQVIDIKSLVTCGDDAGVLFTDGQLRGYKTYIHRMIGPGAGSSAPVAYGGHENIGAYFSGTDDEDVYIGEITDYTYNVLFDNTFSNRVTLGLNVASYKALYFRNGAGGTAFGAGNNTVRYTHIGGEYTFNGDPLFAVRQSRSSNWGVHITGAGTGNMVLGGTVEYVVKPGGIAIQIDNDHNYVRTHVEGHTGATGFNLKIPGNYNDVWLSGLSTPSSDIVTNVQTTGTGNRLFGPVIGNPLVTSYGDIAISGGNYVNYNPVVVPAGNLTFSCDTGAPTTMTGTAQYKTIGTLIWYEAVFTTTNLTGCTGTLYINNLPSFASATRRDVLPGWLNSGLGLSCQAISGTTSLAIVRSDGGAIPTGVTGQCSGWYNAE